MGESINIMGRFICYQPLVVSLLQVINIPISDHVIFSIEFFFHSFKYFFKVGLSKSTWSEMARQAAQGKEVFYHSIFSLITGKQQKLKAYVLDQLNANSFWSFLKTLFKRGTRFTFYKYCPLPDTWGTFILQKIFKVFQPFNSLTDHWLQLFLLYSH